MPCKRWSKSRENSKFAGNVLYYSKHRESWMLDNGPSPPGVLLAFGYKIDNCPFCGSELNRSGCMGGKNNDKQ